MVVESSVKDCRKAEMSSRSSDIPSCSNKAQNRRNENRLIKKALLLDKGTNNTSLFHVSPAHIVDVSAAARVKLPSCSYFRQEGEQEAPGEPRPGSVRFCFKNLSIQFFY